VRKHDLVLFTSCHSIKNISYVNTLQLFYTEVNKVTLFDPLYLAPPRHIASPPKQLFVAGRPPDAVMTRSCVAIVGSRKVSAYGREVTTNLARTLAEQGAVIVGDLALGVDMLVHHAALEAVADALRMLGLARQPLSHHRGAGATRPYRRWPARQRCLVERPQAGHRALPENAYYAGNYRQKNPRPQRQRVDNRIDLLRAEHLHSLVRSERLRPE
jgi:hypothetical protein